MFKKSVISMALIVMVALVTASTGGGGSKKSSRAVKGMDFVKSGNSLRYEERKLSMGTTPSNDQVTIKAFRKGSSFYILPTSYPVASVNNLNALRLKVKMGK